MALDDTPSSSRRRAISTLVGTVSAANLERDVRALVAFRSRQTGTPGGEKAAQFIYDRFGENGYAAARQFQAFPFARRTARNVLCGRRRNGRRLVIVGAHYDSVNHGQAGTDVPAPGADDNASGVAALLEIARIVKDQDLALDVMFAAFAGEEANLAGSRRCAEVAKVERWPVDLYLNVDMIGYRKSPADQVTIEATSTGEHAAASRAYATTMKDAGQAHSSLRPALGPLFLSDHISFIDQGFVAIGVREQSLNIARHSKLDRIDRMDFAYFTETTKVLLAGLLAIAGGGTPS